LLSTLLDTGYGSCFETWTQAMSYCETALPLAGVFSVCPLPAYFMPAVPPALVEVGSLNGAPGDDDECPGVCNALALTVQLFPAVVPGWPVASAAPETDSNNATIVKAEMTRIR
jgi:hypothetical protein